MAYLLELSEAALYSQLPASSSQWPEVSVSGVVQHSPIIAYSIQRMHHFHTDINFECF